MLFGIIRHSFGRGRDLSGALKVVDACEHGSERIARWLLEDVEDRGLGAGIQNSFV